MDTYSPSTLLVPAAELLQMMRDRLITGIGCGRMLAVIFSGIKASFEEWKHRMPSSVKEDHEQQQWIREKLKEWEADQAIVAHFGRINYGTGSRDPYSPDVHPTCAIIVGGANKRESILILQPYAQHADGRVFLGQARRTRGPNVLLPLFCGMEWK